MSERDLFPAVKTLSFLICVVEVSVQCMCVRDREGGRVGRCANHLFQEAGDQISEFM